MVRICCSHKVGELGVGDVHESLSHKLQSSIAVGGRKLIQPKRETFDESAARTESLVVIVLIVCEQLKRW
jgi:hypothetical protein